MRTFSVGLACSASLIALLCPCAAQAQEADVGDDNLIVVTGSREVFNNAKAGEEMLTLQSPITSQLSAIDNLPGVSVQEGDTFGFDDWSTTIAIRGFQTSLDTQQIGITIDGMPNGNSNYGGGAKANRYIDTMNSGPITVSQGTADIASRSNEALGGTIDFTINDPEHERRLRISGSVGQFDAFRGYARYDTGDLFDGKLRAWISAAHQEATDWVTRTAQNHRDNYAGKFIADLTPVKLTGYFSYDDTHENNYEQMYDAASYAKNPYSDTLTGQWSGIPWIDQMYRLGWATLRKNVFGYLKADAELAQGLNVHLGGYYHHNSGRGDWLPPYLVDVVADGAGNPESELTGAVNAGGPALGQIYFVDANGVKLDPIDGCKSSLTFPYGGAGAVYDPACYAPGALGVQSYRHTHYKKDRGGITADFDWNAEIGAIGNLLRGGIWYEDSKRREWRDWHKVIDTRVGYDYENPAYWTQYSRRYPMTTFKWYLSDEVSFGGLTANFGIKQFLVTVDRNDLFGKTDNISVNSDSDVLLSAGLLYETPLRGLQLFGGYAENFKALGDEILERPDSDLDGLKPETSRNIDVGLRYTRNGLNFSATYFNSRFNNRIIFLSPGTATGPDYLIGDNGTYFNGGGIQSDGVELAGQARIVQGVSVYGSYTHTNATYLGTGDPKVDDAVGIIPGNFVAGIAEDMFVTSLNVEQGPYAASISGKWTGGRFVNIANDWKTDAYYLVDFYVGVDAREISDVLKGLKLGLTVNNLFDERYLGGISGGAAWIGAPRTTVLTLTADF